jgi:hypothetical protein
MFFTQTEGPASPSWRTATICASLNFDFLISPSGDDHVADPLRGSLRTERIDDFFNH